MTKAQNSPRGLFKKANAEFTAATVTTLTASTFSGTSTAFGVTTLTAGTLVLGAGANSITSPSAGVVTLSSTGTAPTTDKGRAIACLFNSTGVALMINSTGTTWKYLSTTSEQPT